MKPHKRHPYHRAHKRDLAGRRIALHRVSLARFLRMLRSYDLTAA